MSTAIEGFRRLVLNTMCTKTFADVCAIFLRPVGAGPRFAHASPRLTPWALFLRRFAAGHLALLMPSHGLRRGLHSYAALRLAPDRFLKNAAVRLFTLAVEILRSCYRNISLLMPKYFVPAIEILPD